jgi:hypothetical protein
MPYYTASCKCGKIFQYISTIAGRNDPVECECGSVANRDIEAELAVGSRHKWVSDNPRWSISMGVPPSQVNEFRRRFPNSTYDDRGRLLVKNRKDKLRQANERGFVELDTRR